MKMIFVLRSLTMTVLLSSCTTALMTSSIEGKALNPKPVVMTSSVLNGTLKGFEKHNNYLALTLPFAPMKRVYEQVESRAGTKLIHRGESHVTVLTPPEFDAIKSRVSMTDLDNLAVKAKIQRTHLEAICVGRGEAAIDGANEQTYFLVVAAPELFALRREIESLVKSRGGSPNAFLAERFYPHITIGFTKTDLHESHHVIKGPQACLFDVEVLAD